MNSAQKETHSEESKKGERCRGEHDAITLTPGILVAVFVINPTAS
jgi:hypothetical protein